MSCAWKTAKSFRELGWVLHSPSPTSAKLIIRKGRNCTLFSVFLHALINSLAMFPSSQAGRRTGEGLEAREPGTRRCSCQGPFVEHPWVPLVFYLGMQSPWQRTGVPWRSRKPAVPAAEPHLHPAVEPQLHTGPPRPQPSAPQCPPAAGPGGPAGLTCCLQGGRGSLVLRLQREPPKKLRWPPRAGWCCGRAGIWPVAGTRSCCCCCCCISTSAYYAGENGLFSWSLPALASPCGWHITGQESASLAAALSPFNCFSRVGIGLCVRGEKCPLPGRHTPPSPLLQYPPQSTAPFPASSRAPQPGTASHPPKTLQVPPAPPGLAKGGKAAHGQSHPKHSPFPHFSLPDPNPVEEAALNS